MLAELTNWFVRNLGVILVSAGISALISHFFSIKRDRRREINEVADRMVAKIYIWDDNAQIEFRYGDEDAYLRRVGPLRRRRFRAAMHRYRVAEMDQCDPVTGKITPSKDMEARIAAARKVKKLLARL